MTTHSLNHTLRRWLVSLSGILLGLTAAIALLLWLSNKSPSAQAFSPLPAGEPPPLRFEGASHGPGVSAGADWWVAVKEQLHTEGSISANAIASSSPLTLTGVMSDSFGWSVATAGDVNGDGYSDVVVGAFTAMTGTGRANIYLGSASGPSATPAFTATGEAPSFFGHSVATAGDVNGDGYSDVVIGAVGYISYTGRAYVYLGSATGLSATPAFTATGEGINNYFGWTVGPAGDVNGDGYSDVIIGAWGYNSNQGRAYLYYGSANGLNLSPILLAPSGQGLGISVDTAGDVNGDGYADVIVAAFGQAYVYLGAAGGLNTSPVFTATADGFFGKLVGTAGDVNGDGYADVVVGSHGALSQTGRVNLYLGSASGLSSTPDFTATGEATRNDFGVSTSTAGDINGDGYTDVIIGASGYMSATGRAYIHLGSAGGLSATPVFTATGEATNDGFGYSAATAGDVNGDGYADIIIGAPNFGPGNGRAYFYHGAADAKLYLPLISR